LRGRIIANTWAWLENDMTATQKFIALTIFGGLGAIACANGVRAADTAAASSTPAAQAAGRDGQHDFDFNLGVWRTHIRRVLDPWSGGTHFKELNGTVSVRKVWDGRAWLEEIEADGPDGHWEGMTLFLYNPQAHQWSQNFIDSHSGVVTSPLIGDFRNGRGELYAQDTRGDRTILIRAVWSDITTDAHHFEESYSDDGGKTWAPVFIASLTRQKP
jgi:hypothetical protein